MIVMIFFAVVSSRTENSSFAVLHLLFNMSVSLSLSFSHVIHFQIPFLSLCLCLSRLCSSDNKRKKGGQTISSRQRRLFQLQTCRFQLADRMGVALI